MLATHDKQLEALHQTGQRAVRLGQRGHVHGVVRHEGGLNQCAFATSLKDRVQHLSSRGFVLE
jgi:hypothetical protein